MAVREGYKQTEVGVIPDDWEINNLGDIAIYRRGSFPQPYGLPEWYDEINGTPFVQVYDVAKNMKLKPSTKQKISALAKGKSVFVKKGTVILTIQGSIGRIAITQYDSYVDRTLLIFTAYQIPMNVIFFAYIVEEKFRIEKENAPGGIIKTITKEALSKFELSFPTKAEQTAIANALSDVDALIQSLDALISKKRLIKQGAMQTLLNPYDEHGQLKDGWVVKKLGELCDIRKGALITESTAVNGKIPVVAGGKKPAYFHNMANRFGKCITISASGANAGYVNFFNIPIFASDCSTISDSEDYSIEFIYYQLKLRQFDIYKSQTGGAQPHIHPIDLSPIMVGWTKLTEQNRIATILSDMDAEISSLETKLAKVQAIKQGMMQNLLTGKIRLLDAQELAHARA